jgi:uncharacterized phage protein gp47/JayE
MRLELGVDPLRRSVEAALMKALMGQSSDQYGYLTYIFRQLFPDSADEFFFWRWAGIHGVDQKPATAWTGTATATGTPGTIIPTGRTFTRSDGATFALTNGPVTLDGSGEGALTLAADAAYAGADSNLDTGQTLQFTSPLAGADSAVTITDTTHTGSDVETATEGLARLLHELRTPPSGGGPGDYERWALEVDGVTRAWEYANLEGPNTVSVAFVRDDDGTGAAIIPDADERAVVLAHLQEVAPITVTVYVIELTALPVDVTIGVLSPDTAAVRTAVETSLADFFSREPEPGTPIPLSRLDSAISNADGEVSHVMTDPVDAVTSTTAQMPILGTVSYGA